MKQIRQSKYGNKKTVIDGITFASKKEARRYTQLKILERAGEISHLGLQPEFKLAINGNHVCKYVADFEYVTRAGQLVVEDVKSKATAANRVYRIKKKLMLAIHGIDILET